MTIKRLTAKQVKSITQVRKGETKLGEQVNLVPSFELSLLQQLKEKGVRFCLIGVPECIGVLGNQGNSGTEKAWQAFLSAFLNMQSNRFLKGHEFAILGEVNVDGLQAQAMEEDRGTKFFLQKMHVLCESLDDIVARVVGTVVASGLVPIVIGGGHNNAYPILKGVSGALNAKSGINCINLDAHADYRALEGRHSGNGFSYAKNAGFLNKYFVFGLHQSYNGEHMLKTMDVEDKIAYTFLEDIEYLDKDLAKALSFVYDSDIPGGIELDIDAIRMMPSSAISPTGFSLEQARQFIRKSAQALNVAYLHLPEAAPQSAMEHKLVGKSLAYLVTDLAKEFNKKAQS